MNKSKRLNLRLTDTDYEVFKKTARLLGMNLSEFFRQKLRTEQERFIKTILKLRTVEEEMVNLRRLGKNLNQLLVVTHTHKQLSDDLKDRIHENQQQISAVLQTVIRRLQ